MRYRTFAQTAIDDYEAVKFLSVFGTDLQRGNMSFSAIETLSIMFTKLHPDFYRRMEAALQGLCRRLKDLSISTKRYIANTYLLMTYPEHKNRFGRGPMLIWYYLSWPQENRDELERIFPQLTAEASLANTVFKAYQDLFRYPSDLPDCTDSTEKSAKCARLMERMNFEIFLGEAGGESDISDLIEDVEGILSAIE
ncbi:hypothetical protein QR680_011137 [Steinernema hermaphroditum]|uniref:Uncharacterized protein n=1 Tax=Steinernema hermaphroditum TaxID=289476 RepID=A0AA39MCC1_9BILA|nr:hypothetical protein QR680_011137 [Steinernema hermaphroditum]